MLKKILLGVAAAIVVFVIVVATRPNTFHVERSQVIKAATPIVFTELNDLHRWSAWSPWDKLDPNMKKTFDGPATGIGSSYTWVGSDKVGTGQMTIVDSAPNERVVYKIDFREPMASEAKATITLAAVADGTQVTWAMDGENNFIGKAFCLFVDMDAMIGADFEKGLANLAQVSEDNAKKVADAAPAPAPVATP